MSKGHKLKDIWIIEIIFIYTRRVYPFFVLRISSIYVWMPSSPVPAMTISRKPLWAEQQPARILYNDFSSVNHRKGIFRNIRKYLKHNTKHYINRPMIYSISSKPDLCGSLLRSFRVIYSLYHYFFRYRW